MLVPYALNYLPQKVTFPQHYAVMFFILIALKNGYKVAKIVVLIAIGKSYFDSKDFNISYEYETVAFTTPAHTGFLAQDLFHFTSLVTWGSNGASKEVKFSKELNFLGFVRYFSANINQSSKVSKK